MIKWKISNMEREENGLVINVFYEVYCKKQGFLCNKKGKIVLEGDVNDPDWIPFEELTENTVIKWVKEELGDEANTIEQTLESQVDSKVEKYSNSLQSGLPWNF